MKVKEYLTKIPYFIHLFLCIPASSWLCGDLFLHFLALTFCNHLYQVCQLNYCLEFIFMICRGRNALHGIVNPSVICHPLFFLNVFVDDVAIACSVYWEIFSILSSKREWPETIWDLPVICYALSCLLVLLRQLLLFYSNNSNV